jgi:uncharacterized membrane protein YfcA
LENNILLFILVGFAAQMIDGALGMAYGVSASTFLLSMGVPPAAASASVHIAEVFTTGVSGFSHFKLGNIDKALVKKLAIPGVLGGIAGAYILSNIDGNVIKPFVSVYLLIMGVRILWKVLRKQVYVEEKEVRHMSLLAVVGGFFDAVGGGGWGPIVTTTLIANGNNPRKTIGSVNLTEFFVTFAEAVTFITLIGLVNVNVILGLIIGGVIAAPLGAYLTRKVPAPAMMTIVGLLISFLSVRTIVQALV